MIALALTTGKDGKLAYRFKVKTSNSDEIASAISHLEIMKRKLLDSFDKLTVIYDEEAQ